MVAGEEDGECFEDGDGGNREMEGNVFEFLL